MKKNFKFLSLLMSLLMIMSAISVPAFAESTDQTAQYPNTDSFFWGVDGHLGHQSYNVSDIEEQVALAAKLGAKVYCIDVPGITDITNADKLVRAANAWGMDVLLSLGGESSTPAENTVFYGLVAKHYASGDFGRVKYLKIFNETDNLCIADGGDGTTAGSYDTEKVAAMAARIKAANEAVKDVSQDFVTVVNYSWLHESYLDLVRAQGADWDVTGINWYTNMQEHSYAADGLNTALANLQSYNTLKDKKVIVTESNTWGGSDTLSDSLSEIMSQAYQSDMVIGMCFYELLDEPGNSEGEQNYGLVNYTTESGIGEVKPVYTSIQSLIGGSDSITKSTFVPSEIYPSGETTYTSVKSYDGIITTGSTSGGIEFGETVNLYDYEAVEMDIYVNSLGTDAVRFNYGMQDSNGQPRIATAEEAVPVNQWVHKLVYIDSFVYYGGSPQSIVKFYIDNLPANTIVNITNFNFVSGISPEMNNTYYKAKELNYKLFINGTTNSDYAKKTIGEVVDITKYDYLEFDTYYTGNADSANCNLLAFDTDGKHQCGGATFTKDTWVHCAVATSSFGWSDGDKTKMTAFTPEVLNGGTYIITNMCLTTTSVPKPEANYENCLALDLNADHSIFKSYTTWKNFGTGTTDFTKYDYLEFDFYADKATDNHQVRLVIECDNIISDGKKGQAFYDFYPVADTYVHYVIPISDLSTAWGYNGDKTMSVRYIIDDGLIEDGAGYYFFNLALTTEYPGANYEHYLGTELVKTKKYNTSSLFASFKDGVTDFTKYDYVEFDFKVPTAAVGKNIRLEFHNEGGYGFYDMTVSSDKWIHYVIPVSAIDCGWGLGGDATKFSSIKANEYTLVAGADYKLANLALTTEEEIKPDIMGDANGDGVIDIRDLVCMKKMSAELIDVTDNADTNGDGIFDAEDITLLRKYLLGIISSFDDIA